MRVLDSKAGLEDLGTGRFRGYPEEVQGSPEAVSTDSENDDILEDSTDTLRRCKDLLKRFPQILRTTIKRFRGYPEEMQRSPEAISKDFENDYILEDSTDTQRRCKDLLKRFPKISRTIIYWKIPRIS